MQSILRLGLGLVAAWIVLLSGCGGSGGKLGISGTVKYKGQSVDQGSISFTAAGGQPAYSAAIQNGRYSIPAAQGVAPGTYTVAISSMEGAAAAEAGGLPGPAPKEKIPAEYNSKSSLTKEVKSGQTSFDFDLK